MERFAKYRVTKMRLNIEDENARLFSVVGSLKPRTSIAREDYFITKSLLFTATKDFEASNINPDPSSIRFE